VRAAAAPALAVAALICGGCFGDDEPPAPTPAGEVSVGTPMTIYEPSDRQKLRATTSLADSLRSTVTVRGRVEADAGVVVNSGCAVQRCADTVKAAIDGQWEAHVLVMVARATPTATLVAINSADPSDRASVDVRLDGKAPPKPAKEKKKPKSQPPAPTPTTTPAPTPRIRPHTLIMIGDSLAEGTAPILPGLLPGWSIRTDAKTSRPLAAGMQILAGTSTGSAPVVLAFSLFTNDDPRNVSALEPAVRTSLDRAGPNGCAVWATIARPPLNGVSYAAANRRLTQLAADPALAGRLRVVPWAATVRANPGWLAGDGVHATPEGYRARAQMYADAARSCG
jgi:hypothetical protein